MRSAKNFAMKRLLHLLLGIALGACSFAIELNEEALYGIRTVSFDKNGGDTEAVPTSLTLRPPANTLGSLPKEPTRAGHTFVGWNTEKEGNGSPFTAQTPVDADTLLIVYAQWVALPPPAPQLDIRLSPGTATLTPMAGERSVSFTVTVEGFQNEADASQVKLSIGLVDVEGLLLQNVVSSHTSSSQTASFTVEYNFEKAFDKTPVLLGLGLENIPEGYQYVGGSKTLRIDIVDGLEKTRPIPVNEDNIKAFNAYANTLEGLKRHYKLMGNVELTPPEAGKSNWKAIGTNNRPFTGSFDGGGHTLSGLTIRAVQGDCQGMFGYIGEGAEIKNLGLEGGSVTGKDVVGGLVGTNYGGTVQSSYATGSVTGDYNVGGLVGYHWGRVQNSYATGSVTGKYNVGGLVGYHWGRVQNSYATGSVTGDNYVGGLVGNNWGTVQSSYATGSVTGDNNVGGLVGYHLGTVQNSYATGSVIGKNYVGGLVGVNDWNSMVQNSYATGSVTGDNYVGGLMGQNYKGTTQNSVSLNPSVIATSLNAGRVAGSNNPSLSGNHARNNMELEFSGIPYTPTANTAQADQKDGAGTSEFDTRDFWTDTLSSWNFTEVWDWGPVNLPILRGVGGEQKPKVQELP